MLMLGQKRYIQDRPSAIKMYHSLSSLIMKDTRERREKLTDELMDPKGKWKPLENGDSLYQTMLALEEQVNENKVVTGKLAPDVSAGWLKALERVISKIEAEPSLMLQLGMGLMKWKNDNPGYTAEELNEYLVDPATKMMVNAKTTKDPPYKKRWESQGNRGNQSNPVAAFTPSICFQYRETGSCSGMPRLLLGMW